MRAYVLLILPLMLILSACWDKAELNDRLYVNSAAIDKSEFSAQEEERFVVSVAISDLKESEGTKSAEDEGSENKSVKKSVGRTLSSALRASEQNSSRRLYFGHTKVIFLGEELMNDKMLFMEALDGIQRDNGISRKTLVLAVKGDAQDVASVKPQGEPSAGVFVDSFYKSGKGEATFKMTLEDLLIALKGGEKVIIPSIEEKEGEFAIGGGAVIKNFELTEFLDNEEMRGYLWQRKLKRATVVVKYNEVPVPFLLQKHRSSTVLHKSEEGDVLQVTIEVSGDVSEYIFGKRLFDEQKQMEIEELVSQQIKKEVQQLNAKLEKKADVYVEAKINSVGSIK